MLRTASGMGMMITTSCSNGAADEPPPPKNGVDFPDPREAGPVRDREEDADDEVVKSDEIKRRTSKSDPVGPNEVKTSIVAGRFRFLMVREVRFVDGKRLTS